VKPLGPCTLSLGLLLLSACEGPPSASDLRDWSPADHDRAEENEKIASGAQAAPAGSGAADGTRTLVEATWRQQCVQCHGMVGRGDGPSGPMVKAPDLTREDWQSKVTDDDIAQTIKTGKNRMPKFDLPPQVLAGIVARIRAARGR
jgi:mono/diheme cytochrome c family protein